jgi:hypothetical protein
MKGAALREAIGIRVVSVAIALALFFILASQTMLFVVIVLGWGHFLLAYIYQAEGGHLGYRKAVILAGFLAVFTWAAFEVPLSIYVLVTTIAFLIHFAIDETRLMGVRHSLFTTLEALPYIILYSALLMDVLFGLHIFLPSCAAVLVLILGYAYLSYKKKRRPNQASYAFLGWFLLTLAVYGMSLVDPFISVITLFEGLVIVHYLIWYGFYWFKLMNKTFVQREYVMRAVFLNIFIALLAFLWAIGALPIMAAFFTPLAFYVWTLLHGVASVRKDEFVNSVQVS